MKKLKDSDTSIIQLHLEWGYLQKRAKSLDLESVLTLNSRIICMDESLQKPSIYYDFYYSYYFYKYLSLLISYMIWI